MPVNRRRLIAILLSLLLALLAGAGLALTPANAAAPLCGDGSAPDYGFTYDLKQEHWTVDWQNYVSNAAVNRVDEILDRLNGDSLAQTMILFKSQEQVGLRVNCAVHFLRYMKLGLPSGAHKDNGFVFLIVVEKQRINVHYGVGLGLPALTAPDLTNLNRSAEDTYQSTHSLDQALLTLVQGYDAYVRSKYPPLIAQPQVGTITPTAIPIELPSGPLGTLMMCGMICIAIPIVIFLLWLWIQLARMGIFINPFAGSGSSDWGGGGGGGGPPSRGGGGSGRSGRGN